MPRRPRNLARTNPSCKAIALRPCLRGFQAALALLRSVRGPLDFKASARRAVSEAGFRRGGLRKAIASIHNRSRSTQCTDLRHISLLTINETTQAVKLLCSFASSVTLITRAGTRTWAAATPRRTMSVPSRWVWFMKREKVESSSIAAIGYEATTRTLEIAFTNGHVYQYFGVPTSVHQALMLSESKGKFFNDNIRDAYEFKRVR